MNEQSVFTLWVNAYMIKKGDIFSTQVDQNDGRGWRMMLRVQDEAIQLNGGDVQAKS